MHSLFLTLARIMAALEKTGKADNTIVIFTADHGLACGHHGLMGKQNMYDHSVRVPFVLVGPGIEKDRRIDTGIYLQDIMPANVHEIYCDPHAVRRYAAQADLVNRLDSTSFETVVKANGKEVA